MDEEKVLNSEETENIENTGRRSAKKGKPGKWLILLLVVVILFLGTYIVKSEVKIHELQKEKAVQEEENARLEREKEELQNELENINSDEYIEYMARKNLNMVKSGELIFMLPEDDEQSDGAESDD